MIKRAIVYCRVSTDEQAENGYSLSTQMEACRKYVESLGYTIVGSRWYDLKEKKQVSAPNENTFPVPAYADDFTGAVPIEQRPEGKKAFTALRDSADALIVYRIDRLVRPPEDGDEWDTPVLVRRLAKLDKEIHTVDRGLIRTDFASLLIAMLDARTAGEERRKIAERTSRGRYAKARAGKVVCSGRAPFGYDFGDGLLVIDTTTSEIVRLIYRMFIEDHLSMRVIASRLSEASYTAPKGGTSWHHNTVARILSSEVYIGKYYYGISTGENICVSVPRLVTDGDFEAAKKIRKYNSEIAQRNRKRTYLLSGMVRCGCGFAMIPQRYPDDSIYYRCSRRAAEMRGLEACQEHSVRAQKIEDEVWKYIHYLLVGDFEEAIHEAQEVERAAHEPQLSELSVIDAMLAEIDSEAEQLAKAIANASGIVLSKIQKECDTVSARHAHLLARRQAISSEIDHKIQLTPEAIESLVEFQKRILRGLDHATEEDKRKYYEILQVRVTVKDGKIQTSCVIVSRSSS